ncbi:cadherin-like beta sandwich domain-containing protein [Paenibacillus chondroitinus]|uniref:Cadherin-like beta sandwich domain-containing protein n=1 Tax=Paenibacillus chondroitinus TaxID=59842 RepID=A0ABU6D9Y1_9BACL|nr:MULTISPECIES: cadherin-like beta sandwich domain-containing protein [Paenibacillus]MCY9656576.1 cadherin-like beta sandwich domain-containing protein [Paenibacillus anseongense]MEB4794225.1 cadherin-like beta sandwich domain-containing protein [Paenibacillus chondroitinus]
MNRRRKAGWAKLLIAALLLQYIPLLHGGLSVAQAAGVANGTNTVLQNTYGPATKITDYTWSRVTTNLAPDPRQGASMVFDEMAENVVMFGGQDNNKFFDETWIWDGKQKTWQEQLNLASSPPKRKGAAMAYDPGTGKVLLFGGEGQSGVLLGDTWLWDGMNATWEQVTGLPDSPIARGGAQIAFDGEQLVLFGGYSGSGSSKTLQDDTWLWNGTGWTEVDPAEKPPAAYGGQMAFDGQTAVLYGGNAGSITKEYTSTGTKVTKSVTHDDSSPLLWKWNRETKSWSSTAGPEGYGRWGQAMAYDGRRVVFFGGERDYVHNYDNELIKKLKLPTSTYPPTFGSMAYSWYKSGWEKAPLKFSTGVMYKSNMDKDGKVYEVQGQPNQVPFPLSYASMAFDGKNFVMFGGSRDQISIMDKVFGSVVDSVPAGNMNETWLYGYTPPTAPGVKLTVDPMEMIYFDPKHIDDTISVVTNVYDDGTKDIIARGVEYREYLPKVEGKEQEFSNWIQVPYTGTEEGTSSFTVVLKGLKWQQKYQVRGYAANEIGKSYTEPVPIILNDDDQTIKTPDVLKYDRIGPSVLHVKDKKRLVAVGTGIPNLFRKPVGDIHYYLQSKDGIQYSLKTNVINERQLELFWDEKDGALPPGKYDIHLNHVYYGDYVFPEGLLITALDFYKPRNFARVDVPSTSTSNEVNSLGLQGPFTEDPSAQNVYVLNDPSEPVVINDSVMFKGTSLVVDKTKTPATITGNGRLYVNGGGALGSNLSYTIHDGPFTITSDKFSFDLSGSEATDYLNMDMPVKASSLIFTKEGLRLTGDLEIGLQVGSQKIKETVPFDGLKFRNNRFDLSGTFTMKNSFQVGPIKASDTKFVVESRIPYVGVQGTGSLPDTKLSFDLNMRTKQGRLDSVNFGMYQKVKLASTGLQVNYLFGSVDKLAEMSQIPQKFAVTGSVNDVIVPEMKHPQANYKFNLIGTDSIDTDLTTYGFNGSGTEYYYWLPVKNMNMQTVVNPATAGIKGFSSPGFATKGDINLFEVVKGAIGTYSFNQKGFNGAIKGTVYVPKGIPRIGGATVSNVALSVNETGVYGTFKHNGVGANLKYTFNNNTILFEVEAEPPKKSWWEKGLDFVNNVSDFMDAAEPWLDIAEELFLRNTDSGNQSKEGNEVRIAAANPLKRVFDLRPVSLSFQPEEPVHTDAKARIVNGQLTSLDQTPLITTETNAANGKSTASFAVERSFTALFALTGDQRAAVLKATASGQGFEQTLRPEISYDAASQMTYMRVSLFAGKWSLTTNTNSHIQVNELLFANGALNLSQLAELWSQTPDRSVTSFTVKERGSYVLNVGEAQGDVIVYKPDGRPYSLNTAQNEANWNALRDANGHVYTLVDAVEAGTWMISAGTSPSAVLSTVSSKVKIEDVAQWVQDQAYPTVFDMTKTDNGQAIVEIYGANEQTKLYAPNGELYKLQTDPSLPGLNVLYDESQQKKTYLLDGIDLSGQWQVVSSSFTNVVAYKSTRKFKSIKPLTMEGRFGKYFDIAEKGDYMLTVSGGNANTVITAPDGSPYTLNFDAPAGNAYLQPASDRVTNASPGGDPLEQTKVTTPNPVNDSKDTLYVTLLNAPAGKWMIQNAKKVDLQIQKLIPQPEIKASVKTAAGAENRVQVAWSMENASSDAQVTMMLTDSADQWVGEVIQSGLPSSGSKAIDLPTSMLPGTYYLSVVGESADKAPIHAIAETTVEVTAPISLSTPEQPKVLSTGNGEISLHFASIAGNVTAYRIWVSDSTSGKAAVPVMDITPEAGSEQNAVMTGLTAGATYQIAVSAIGNEQGRVVLSPTSASVTTDLPVPQPSTLAVALDAGAQPVIEQTYTSYDGNEETLLLTTAEQASLKVTANQAAALTLFVNGQQLGSSEHVAAGGTSTFVLQDLLQTAVLKEREYNVLVEAVNERGDRSTAYRKVFIDRTGPMLIASGGNDAQGKPISLNGIVTDTSRVYIAGQTDAGAKLVVNGIQVPLDDKGKFDYYAPLEWGTSTDRVQLTMTATDRVGNKTEYGFEVIRGVAEAIPATPSDLAALTTGNAQMRAPYQFGTTAYQALAYSDNVRIYAVPMAAASVVTIDGKPVSESGYVDIAVPVTGKSVSIKVHSDSAGDKFYTLSLDGTGSNEALLATLKLTNATASQKSDVLPAQAFTGAEESYAVYVDNTVDTVTLTPGAMKAGSSIKVKGQSVQSGQASQAIQLQVGENQVPVEVTSPDGAETRSYQVAVWREPSGNALLQSLGLATDGADLLADFNPAVKNYEVLVPYTALEFKLLPVPEQSDAEIHIDGQKVTSGAVLPLPFTKDAQTYAIEVKAQDGTTLTYNVSVLRKQTVPGQPPLLASLQAGTILDGAFTPYKLKYGTISTTESANATIKAITNDPEATVTVQHVKQKGGGTFEPALAIGSNTIIVNVESADLKSSQTYSIDVKRIEESSSSPDTRQTTVAGSSGGWTFQTNIVRTQSSDGKVLDTVKLDGVDARRILEKAAQNNDQVARIYVTDLPENPADERIVSLNSETVSLLAGGGMALQLVLPDGQITVSAESLKQMSKDGKDAYFRIVPVRVEAERSEVTKRVQAAELVLKDAGDRSVSIIGQPVKIETNYSGYKTEVVFPLNNLSLPDNAAAAKEILDELAVYIEHSDGEKVLTHGEIRYDADGKPVGIAIEISKFSTFTIIQKNGANALQPYLSGYPDGTFRPSQAITRAELAMILNRIGAGKSGNDSASAQPSGYPDVAKEHWAAEAIANMQRAGVMLGDDTGFRPDDAITRGEMASIAARLLPAGDGSTSYAGYSDTQQHWAFEAIKKASQAGILQGYSDGTFLPEKQLNRAEAVTILNRLFKRPTADVKSSSWPDVPQEHWALREIESASGTVQTLSDGSVYVVPNH